MLHRVVAALAAILLTSSVRAAAVDELAEFRRELQELKQRVERLEAENVALQARNAELQGQPAAAVNALTSHAAADGVSERIAVKGDLRYRHQQTDDARQPAQRDEHLVRARVALEARVAEGLNATVGMATTEGGNPRGANMRLDNEFSRKSLDLDLAFIDWSFAKGAHALAGKMRMPFVRPGQSLFWDNDVNPEGVAVTYARGPWFGVGYGFWIDENVARTTVPSAADTADTKMFGVQLGRRFEFGESKLTLAGMYYDLAAAEQRRPFFNGSSNGNTLTLSGGLAYDFQVAEIMVEFNARLAGLPLQLWVDVAHNRAAELDTALAAGAVVGRAAKPSSWELGLMYQFIEKDALFAQHIDSDFAGGVSDSAGWVLRAGYAPAENWVLNAAYFASQGDVDVGDEFDFDRLLLDFNVKF